MRSGNFIIIDKYVRRMDGSDLRDEIFRSIESDIFENRALVDISHVPDLERIVGRDHELREIGKAIAPAAIGAPPESVTIYGKTGTGKSLVARSTTRTIQQEADGQGVNFASVYIDCSCESTVTKASSEMARSLEKTLDADRDIPLKGYSGSHYQHMTWEMLNDHNVETFIVILDEVDLLDSDQLLHSLSRAKESGKTDTLVGVICISNKIEYRQELNERVNSSLQDREHVFDPYDATQIREILESRRDAFKEDILEEGVIPKIAAHAAQEHGDARKAVDMLAWAGRLAEREDSPTVTEDFVDEARHQAEVNRFQKLISGNTPHAKYVLRTLALLTANTDTKPEFKTTELYNFYQTLCTRIGVEPLSKNRVTVLLKEQSFLGLTESEHTGDGNGGFVVHRLTQNPEIVLRATEDL